MAQNLAQDTWNGVKAIGPFIISQSDKMSEAFVRHQGRLAELEVMKTFHATEIQLRNEVRSKLYDKYISASADERIRIEADLERMDGEIRRLGIGAKALNYAPQTDAAPNATAGAAQAPPIVEISDHWLDRFNELARLRNEPWRAEMLSRALAIEKQKPGSISGRSLWMIGTMEASLFHAFSALLNLSFWPYPVGEPFLPDIDYASDKTVRLVLEGKAMWLGHIVFQAEQAGLLGNILTSSRPLAPGSTIVLLSGDQAYAVKAKSDFALRGILLSPLGATLALFHEPKWAASESGRLEKWVDSLPKDQIEITKLRRKKSV